MQGHDHRDAALFDGIGEEMEDEKLMVGVKAAGGFVQKEEPRFLRQRPGDEDALAFAAAQLPNVAEGKAFEVQPLQEVKDEGFVFFRVASPKEA